MDQISTRIVTPWLLRVSIFYYCRVANLSVTNHLVRSRRRPHSRLFALPSRHYQDPTSKSSQPCPKRQRRCSQPIIPSPNHPRHLRRSPFRPLRFRPGSSLFLHRLRRGEALAAIALAQFEELGRKAIPDTYYPHALCGVVDG